jgi:hypothetical protein
LRRAGYVGGRHRITMIDTPRLFASSVFAAIAIFLVIYTWLPARNSLQREEAKVTNIISKSNTWHEVEIITSNGTRITCRTRRGWPLAGPNSCPLEKFEHLLGGSVTVMHDGKRPYEVTAGKEIVIDYSAHQKAQIIATVLAGLMLAMAALVWKRK